MTTPKADAQTTYRALWESKPTKQIERELKSWQSHFAKHEGHYSFHGATAHPGEMTDGERVMVLKDILRERELERVG